MAAAGLPAERVRVTGVRAGSVWVDMTLFGDERLPIIIIIIIIIIININR